MNVGQAHQPRPADLPHYPRHYPEATVQNSSAAASSTDGRPRGSSQTLQSTPAATTEPQPQESPHIRFRGASTTQALRDGPTHNSEASHLLNTQDTPRADHPPPSPRLQPTYRSTVSLNASLANSPSRIKVRDLSHIQSFASEELLTRSRHASRHSLGARLEGGQQYEISAMPVTDIIEMVAGLLTKITTTNDQQHEHVHRHVPAPDGSSGLSQQSSSVLAFHGKNVPSITIASYLARIHKYCPTTYEVFISLLIYFDRMAATVNGGSISQSPKDEQQGTIAAEKMTTNTHEASGALNLGSPMATTPSVEDSKVDQTETLLSDADAYELSHYFVVDSFNIHRLVMAGVTCASKFFSDVFYTNSRYAKVTSSSCCMETFLTIKGGWTTAGRAKSP